MTEQAQDSHVAVGDRGHHPSTAAGGARAVPRRPFWRRLLRGLAFMPIGLLSLPLLTWLLGGIGVGIWIVSMLGLFAQGFAGEPLPGFAKAEPSIASVASASLAVTPVLTQRRRRGLWWKIPLSIVGLLFTVAFIAALSGTEGDRTVEPARDSQPRPKANVPPEPPKPETLEDRVGAANVTRAGDFLLVRTTIGTVWSPKWVIIEAANRLFRIGRWAGIDAAQRTPGTKLALQVYAKTTDQYGRESDSLILILAIDPTKFALINWSNFDAERLLNLVEIEQLWPAAEKAAIEFCRDGSRASLAPSFCAQAARFVR